MHVLKESIQVSKEHMTGQYWAWEGLLCPPGLQYFLFSAPAVVTWAACQPGKLQGAERWCERYTASRGSSREDCKRTRDIRKSLKYLFNLSLFISTDSSPFNYSVIAL